MLACSSLPPLKLLLDLRCDLRQRVSLRCREIGFFILAEDLQQVDRLFGGVEVVDHPHTPAFASATPGEPNLANATGTDQEIARRGANATKFISASRSLSVKNFPARAA